MSNTSQFGFPLGSPLGGAATSSGNLTVDVSDSLSFSDSVNTDWLYGFSRSASDTFTLSDSVAIRLTGASVTYAIIIDPTQVGGTDLTNYPLRFGVMDGSYPWLASVVNGGSVQDPNGYDITFSSDFAGFFPIAFERVFWDPATGNCKFFALVPSVSHTLNTVVYVHAGASTNTDQSNAPAVWIPSNHVCVQHFGNGTTLDVSDSTGLNSPVNHGATATSGVDGGAALFDGSTTYVDNGNGAVNVTTDITLSAWVNITSGAGTNRNIAGNSNGTNGYQFFINASDSRQQPAILVFKAGSSSNLVSGYHSAIGAGWIYLTARSKVNVSNGCTVFVDGADNGSDGHGGTGGLGSTSTHTTVGKSAAGEFFPGAIAELRISTSYQPDGWNVAVYNNTKAASTFYTVNNIPTGAILSQFALEMGYLPGNATASVTQMLLEATYKQDPFGKVSQYVLEVAVLFPPPPPFDSGWKLTEV